MVLGLLWGSNVYAATNIYLTCPLEITEDNSDDLISDVFSETDGFISQIYANIKISSSNIKLKLHHQSPAKGDDWANRKPDKDKDKYEGYVEDNHYIFEAITKKSNKDAITNGNKTYDFYKEEGGWFVNFEAYSIFELKKSALKKLEKIDKSLALDLKTVKTDLVSNENICVEYDQKEFKSIIKKGILKAEDF